jgi:hypothetical protein
MSDVRIESERSASERSTAVDGLRRAHEAIEATRIAKAARESELASARIEHEWRSRSVRAREHELAGLSARLTSLEELDAARAGYGDAARTVLVQANGKVNQRVRLPTTSRSRPATSAPSRRASAICCSTSWSTRGARGRRLSAGREAGAGRCGFLVTDAVEAPARVGFFAARMSVTGDAGLAGADVHLSSGARVPDGVVALSSVVRVNGPFASAIRQAIGEAGIAQSYDGAAAASRLTPLAIATLEGDVFRGPHLVSGGGRAESRGILRPARNRELRDRIVADREALMRLAQETAELEATMAHAGNAIAALNAEHHKQERWSSADAPAQHDRRGDAPRAEVRAARPRAVSGRRRAARSIAGRKKPRVDWTAGRGPAPGGRTADRRPAASVRSA